MPRSWLRAAALMVCLSAAAAGQERLAPLGAGEHLALGALGTQGLAQSRAGWGRTSVVLSASEREQLVRLAACHDGLDALRAGELTEHDIDLIFISAAIVMAIVILAQ